MPPDPSLVPSFPAAEWAKFGILALIIFSLLGLVGWAIRHMITVTIPNLTEAWSNRMKDLIAEFKEESRLERAAYQQNHKEQMDAHKETQAAVERLREAIYRHGRTPPP